MHNQFRNNSRSRVAPILLTLIVAIGCSDSSPIGTKMALPIAPRGFAAFASCGASFRMITTDDDSLLAQYDIPATVDTVDVCEGWTGSDYTYQATVVGSSDDLPGFDVEVPIVAYESGYLTGYSASGSVVAPSTSAGGTAFDFVVADSATRQASFDYPYYGISSPDPHTCIICPAPTVIRESGATSQAQQPNATASANSASGRFQRHRLSRKAVRALVDDAEEIAPSPEGYRRFRAVHGEVTTVRSIDPKTELLLRETAASRNDTTSTVHTWRQVPGGYVRDRSQTVNSELIDGRWIRNHGVITFQNVRVNDTAFVTGMINP